MDQTNTQNTISRVDPHRADYIYNVIFNIEYPSFKNCSVDDCGDEGIKAVEQLEQGNGLYIYGEVGRGKTHLALSCLKWWLDQKYYGYLFPAYDIFDRLRYFINQKNTEAMDILMREIMGFPLLIIDDLGTQKNTEWTDEKMYEIINTRWNRRDEYVTIITSNYKPSELIERFKEPVMGKRIVDRIIGMCEKIELKGQSRRITR